MHTVRIVCAFVLLATPLAAQISTAALAPDRDNTIYSPAATKATFGPSSCSALSNGSGDKVVAGLANGTARRGLLHFDVAGNVPTGATVLQVELDLNVVRVPGYPTPNPDVFALHPALADWGEGGSNAVGAGQGAAPQLNDATWCDRFFLSVPAAPWTTPGGDFGAASATALVGVNLGVTHTFPSTLQLVSDVQGWLNAPASNFGWFLLGDETGATGLPSTRGFAAREDAALPSRVPRLLITYYVAPLPFWSGCDTTGAAAPTLGIDPAVGLGRPAIGNTFRIELGPGGSAFLSTSLALATAPIPGGAPLPSPFTPCLLQVTANLWVGPTDPAFGLTLALPPNPSMVGTDLYWQGLAITTAPGLALTHGHVTHIRN